MPKEQSSCLCIFTQNRVECCLWIRVWASEVTRQQVKMLADGKAEDMSSVPGTYLKAGWENRLCKAVLCLHMCHHMHVPYSHTIQCFKILIVTQSKSSLEARFYVFCMLHEVAYSMIAFRGRSMTFFFVLGVRMVFSPIRRKLSHKWNS